MIIRCCRFLRSSIKSYGKIDLVIRFLLQALWPPITVKGRIMFIRRATGWNSDQMARVCLSGQTWTSASNLFKFNPFNLQLHRIPDLPFVCLFAFDQQSSFLTGSLLSSTPLVQLLLLASSSSLLQLLLLASSLMPSLLSSTLSANPPITIAVGLSTSTSTPTPTSTPTKKQKTLTNWIKTWSTLCLRLIGVSAVVLALIKHGSHKKY